MTHETCAEAMQPQTYMTPATVMKAVCRDARKAACGCPQSAAKETVHSLYEYCPCTQEGQSSNMAILLQASYMPMQAAPFHRSPTTLNALLQRSVCCVCIQLHAAHVAKSESQIICPRLLSINHMVATNWAVQTVAKGHLLQLLFKLLREPRPHMSALSLSVEDTLCNC